jgi:peptidoglycan/xylan/chitin deacetylase (PgdA/CDA1 family)
VRTWFVIGLAVLVAVVAAGAVWRLTRPETMTVFVGVEPRSVPRGATLADAVERFALRPRAGDLVDVRGAVLRREAFPGRVLLEGSRAPGPTKLVKGDRIQVVNGRDRREPLQHTLVRVPGGQPGNPQFTLARTPGEQDVVRGRVSHELFSATFRPTGSARVPRAVALTFDDGPSEYTARILAILRRFHVPATFFVVGNEVERRPNLVRRELAAGMDVGNHSYSHPYRPPFDRQPHPRILREIARGRAVLTPLGHDPTLFRPPGGTYSDYVLEATGAVGERVVLWSVDPTDWEPGLTWKQVARNVLGAVHPGSIVIMHDGGGDRTATVRALPKIIRGLRKKGLRLVLVDPTSAVRRS